jgi:transcription antitermination factor NusA-like protein
MPATERLGMMDIERWLDKEIIKIIERGASKRALASLIKDALAKAREQSITASEMTIFLTNAFFDSSIKMIEDAWVECGCRYAEMVILIRDKIGNEQTIELRV